MQRKWDAVHRERKRLEAENELERARHKAHILEEDDGQNQLYRHGRDKECHPTPVPATLQSPYPNKRPSSRTFSSDSKDTKAVPSTRVPLNPAAPEWKGGRHLSTPAAKPHKDVPSHVEKIHRLLQQQQRTIQLQQQSFQSMASTIRQGFALPKHELSRFDGKPLDFWNFIRTFESNIERNVSDESEKLSFLLQYCSGAARNAIKSCVSMDPLLGYQTAKALLEDRFGNLFKVATAYLNEVINGPPVRPYDSKALLAFADTLRDCTSGLESIGYLEEINSADNLRRIVNRLPFHLKTKLLEVADSVQQSGQRTKIHHISQLVTTNVRVANNPVFGASLNEGKERRNPE